MAVACINSQQLQLSEQDETGQNSALDGVEAPRPYPYPICLQLKEDNPSLEKCPPVGWSHYSEQLPIMSICGADETREAVNKSVKEEMKLGEI